MFNTSTLYKNLAHSSGRRWNAKAHIILTDSTELDLSNDDFMAEGIGFEDGTSEQGIFTIGSAVIKELTMMLNNFRGKFTEYDFTDAVIYPFVGLTVQNHYETGAVIEWIPLGKFKVDEHAAVGSVIRIVALDDMEKFDKPYSTSTLNYPATLAQIVSDACVECGVTNNANTFTNSDYVVTTKPSDDSITFREIVSYAAQLAGCFARINRDGALEFGWYDFDRFTTPLPAGKQAPAEFRISSSYDIATSDITITGIQIVPDTSDGNIYTYGSDGYVVKIENNPLAQSNLQSLVDSIGAKIVGMTFTPYTVTTYADPSIDCGDVVLVTDKKGNVHRSFVSTASYRIGTHETFSADAETISKNQSTRFSKTDKAQETADNAIQGVEEAKASIEAANGQIALKASKATLISEINICPESIKISSDRIDITGLVTVSDLEGGETTIDGACIRTGRIESQDGSFWVDLETGDSSLGKGTFSGEIIWNDSNGNTIGSIRYAGQAGLEISAYHTITIESSGGVSINKTTNQSVSVGGDLSVDGYVSPVGYQSSDGDVGKTTQIGIVLSNGETRILQFKDGLLTDNDA
jgi:hypothetical protein